MWWQDGNLELCGGKITFRHCDIYYVIEAEVGGVLGELVVYSGNTGRNKVDPARLAAWAKAGCPDWEKGNDEDGHYANQYRSILEAYDIRPFRVCLHIDNLTADRDRLKARVAELEGAKEPKPQAEMRCVDCEHLALGSVKDGYGFCVQLNSRWNIYNVGKCYTFTPAQEGCGSADQALRTELARKTKEGC
jgi:hypothetical protein